MQKVVSMCILNGRLLSRWDFFGAVLEILSNPWFVGAGA